MGHLEAKNLLCTKKDIHSSKMTVYRMKKDLYQFSSNRSYLEYVKHSKNVQQGNK